ncbi:peptidylprolyl isomerase [Aurantiacibacter sp. MUD11]|uniref:peptidylprolyl isomerase n=1 Tax=Aurantiacibacter sp. MUD11 TaxID=3003265 RepID=UPI0022AAF4C8|nr:peptidylprolyl isomerase [Aurantiacibacter sp. MUD11]WAT18437.1 peptidylprolyl isomerase [Aurantiacibacter sp. MUD11]
MIQLFRKFFQSKLGIGVTLAFLGVIAIAFASSDVANTGMFGGVTGGDRVAVVGDRRISTSDLITGVNSAVTQERANNPTITMEAFVSQGGMEDVLDQMISRAAIGGFAEMLGLRAGPRLIDSEIVTIPAFRGIDGNFSADSFRQALQQQGLSEATVRDDLGMGLLARQLVLPIAYSATLPESITRRYAALNNERRIGSAVPIPAAAFAPEGDPSEEELQGYYQANRGSYIRPERRVLRYVTFDDSALGDLAPVTDEQVARRYERDAAIYAASEERSFTQLVVPTEAAAQAVIDEVNGGMALEASARSKGLDTVSIEAIDRAAFQSQTSAEVAAAAFAGSEGALVGPQRGELGWYVLRVDEVNQIAGQTLAQATPDIRQQLQEERRRLALNELTVRLEDEFADGRSLSEAAAELGLDLATTQPLIATGQVYERPERAPEELARVLDFAFQMDEGQPQLAEIVPGQQFLLFEVSQITRSATAPLAEIKEQVTLDWRRERGMAEAGAAAGRVLERVEGGATLAEALAEEDVRLPAPEPLNLSRRELAAQGQLSRASILFFSMAEGTTKRVEMDEANTWFVVQLDEIQAPELAADDPLLAQARQQLGGMVGEEYVTQFIAGAQEALEVETNQPAIDAVRSQLLGLTQ